MWSFKKIPLKGKMHFNNPFLTFIRITGVEEMKPLVNLTTKWKIRESNIKTSEINCECDAV